MGSTARSALLLAFSVGVNTADVAAEQRWRLFTRVFGRGARLAHAALILPPWILFLRSLGSLPARQLKIGERTARRWGAPLTAAGIGLSVAGFKELGPGALVNQDQFAAAPRRSTSGIYGLFRHPIYVGYSLAMAGWAVRRRSVSGLALALEMYALLLLVQAPVEARALSPRPRRRPSPVGLSWLGRRLSRGPVSVGRGRRA